MTDLVKESREGAVLRLTLNRPQKKNALTGEMYGALLAAFDAASADDATAVILIEGEGGAFTAGNDIGDFLAGAQTAFRDGDVSPGGKFIRALARFEKPIVAAVEGQAVGIGTTLCFHCDLVYAAPNARFLMPFVNLGLVPEAGSSMLAPMRFGRARAAEMLLLAEPFGAETAREIGFVNAIVPAAELRAHALAKAQALAAKPRAALLATRKLLRGDSEPLYAHMEAELVEFARALRSPEAKAAFMSFLEKPKACDFAARFIFGTRSPVVHAAVI
jgi:enoyl-CoA hydratase/carnithine racemase